MNRNIITSADVRTGPLETIGGQPTVDDYWARLVKYLPVEMIGAYLAVVGVLSSVLDGAALRLALGSALVAGAVAVWWFAANVLRVTRRQQRVVSTVAFVLWVFATGGVFGTFGWWAPWMGSVAVVVFGVVVRIIQIGPPPEPEPIANGSP